MNTGAALALGALGALAIVVNRWAADDYEQLGRLSTGSSVAAWALYTLHGAAVVLAAVEGVWLVDVPAAPAIAVGVPIAVAGALFAIAGASRFGSRDQLAGRSNERLVTDGVYRYSRHPQNVGWATALLGVAIAGRSALALVLVAALWVIFLRYVSVEERHLLNVYGKAYRRYRERTPRLLGRPAPARGRR